jgi:hypothetical protein
VFITGRGWPWFAAPDDFRKARVRLCRLDTCFLAGQTDEILDEVQEQACGGHAAVLLAFTLQRAEFDPYLLRTLKRELQLRARFCTPFDTFAHGNRYSGVSGIVRTLQPTVELCR